MKKFYIILIVLLIAVFCTAVYLRSRHNPVTETVSVPTGKPIVRDCSFSDDEILSDINSVRTNKVSVDQFLESKAQTRADSLTPSLDSHDGFNRMVANYELSRYAYIGEVLASNDCPSTFQLWIQWKNSPGHWAVINNERYDVVGIGFKNGVAVVIFGDLP